MKGYSEKHPSFPSTTASNITHFVAIKLYLLIREIICLILFILNNNVKKLIITKSKRKLLWRQNIEFYKHKKLKRDGDEKLKTTATGSDRLTETMTTLTMYECPTEKQPRVDTL